jgi:hypothetical protein
MATVGSTISSSSTSCILLVLPNIGAFMHQLQQQSQHTVQKDHQIGKSASSSY